MIVDSWGNHTDSAQLSQGCRTPEPHANRAVPIKSHGYKAVNLRQPTVTVRCLAMGQHVPSWTSFPSCLLFQVPYQPTTHAEMWSCTPLVHECSKLQDDRTVAVSSPHGLCTEAARASYDFRARLRRLHDFRTISAWPPYGFAPVRRRKTVQEISRCSIIM